MGTRTYAKEQLDPDFTILVAEDDEDYSLLLKRAFDQNGIAVTASLLSDGEEVIEYLEGTGKYAERTKYPIPSLILLDVKMRRKGGMDVLRWMQDNRRYASIPTVILSSSERDEDVKLAYGLGARSYLVKPAQFDQLKSMLRTLCDFWMRGAKGPVGEKGA